MYGEFGKELSLLMWSELNALSVQDPLEGFSEYAGGSGVSGKFRIVASREIAICSGTLSANQTDEGAGTACGGTGFTDCSSWVVFDVEAD